MDTSAAHHPTWEDYRRRRNSLLGAIFSWTALMLIPLLAPETPLIGRHWWLLALPILAWFTIASLRITLWHCPRCGDLYFTRGIWFGNLFIARCYHCGLPKWADPGSVARGA